MNLYFLLFLAATVTFTVFSYGFVDPNLVLSVSDLYSQVHGPLYRLVYTERHTATVLLFLLISVFSICYLQILRSSAAGGKEVKRQIILLLCACSILILSFPALTYDMFNYILTAKVTYTYHENPYLVMPVEIPNEPNLAFTRAANKLALYGPVWILLTALPHVAGGGNIWLTILAYKYMNFAVYIAFAYFVLRVTKSYMNAAFFLFNPLVLVEVLVGGHNDIYMVFPALTGLYLWRDHQIQKKLAGMLLFISSWWVKGATVLLTPLLFLKKPLWETVVVYTYWSLFAIFLVAAPLREELYPWYAVWIVMAASLLPLHKYTFITGFTIVSTLSLELRHLPYLWMGYYEGPGPVIRTVVSVLPPVLYIIWYSFFRKNLVHEKT